MRQLPGVQDGFNRKGLFSNLGEKKEAFFVLQKNLQRLGNSWHAFRLPPTNSRQIAFPGAGKVANPDKQPRILE
jgi:hypothetical protein